MTKWTKQAVMAELEQRGTAQNRKVYARHGVTGEAFGVSYADLGKLRRSIGTDHALARALWETGNHDARVLATFVADPEQLDRKLLDDWSKDLRNYVVTDAVATMVAPSPSAPATARRWIKSRDEWVSTAGWNLVARLAEEAFEVEELKELLATIEAGIASAPNRTRYAMNGALISIGLRSGLTAAAKAAAGRIGPVEVDHGETGCKTPEAASYIDKTLAHRKKKASKKKASKKKAAGPPARKA